MTYSSLCQFTDDGMLLFEKAFSGQLEDTAVDLEDQAIAQPISGTRSFEVEAYETAGEMADAILQALGTVDIGEAISNTGLWSWLTFVLRDVVFTRDVSGRRKVGEIHKWYPAGMNDWQKGQRHLIRMPVQLRAVLGADADHLLCKSPSVGTEIREQLTSQQDMFHPGFQRVARTLYYDDEKQDLKRGAGGKGPGSPRRLAKIRQQLDVTWDLYSVSPQRLLQILPKEFDRFKPQAPGEMKPAA